MKCWFIFSVPALSVDINTINGANNLFLPLAKYLIAQINAYAVVRYDISH